MLNFSPLDGLKSGYSAIVWLYAAGMFIGVHGGVSAMGLNGYVATFFFIIAAVSAIATVYEVIKIYEAKAHNTKTYHTFARANNFEFLPVADSALNGTGTLFTHGHGKNTKNLFRGKTAAGLPFETFHYEYTTGSGKNRQSHYAGVMRITLPRTLPHMVIDSLVEGDTTRSVLPIHFDQSQRIRVEGDFNDYFSLYAPDTYAVSMLSIIGPDVMWALMQHAAACDIEIIDNYIYFYWPYVARRRSEYESMFATADAVMKEVGKKLVQGNIYTSDSQAQLHSAAQTGGMGVRLKQGTPATAIALILIFVFIYGQPLLAGMAGLPQYIAPNIFVAVFAGIAGYAVYANYKKQKRRKQLIRRFGPSEQKHQ